MAKDCSSRLIRKRILGLTGSLRYLENPAQLTMSMITFQINAFRVQVAMIFDDGCAIVRLTLHEPLGLVTGDLPSSI